MFVEGDAVAEVVAAVDVSFNRLFHQARKGFLALFRCFIQTHNKLFVSLERFREFRLKRFDSHAIYLRESGRFRKVKAVGIRTANVWWSAASRPKMIQYRMTMGRGVLDDGLGNELLG